jgi:hypothetical protein
MLHEYGIASSMSRSGNCRRVVYMDKGKPEVRYKPSVCEDVVLVSIPALKEAFFNGIYQYLIDAFSDQKKAKVVE